MACSVEPNHHSCEYYFWVIQVHTIPSVSVFSGSEDALSLESAQNYVNSFFYCNYYKEIFVCFKELLYELELFILISRKEDCCCCCTLVLRITVPTDGKHNSPRAGTVPGYVLTRGTARHCLLSVPLSMLHTSLPCEDSVSWKPASQWSYKTPWHSLYLQRTAASSVLQAGLATSLLSFEFPWG